MEQTTETRALPIERVYPNPAQPRKVFDAEGLQELAASIQTSGLMQPITVVLRPTADGEWMIVAGERRFRASKLAGLPTIEAIIRVLTDEQVAELALIENLIRRDLNEMEEARAYKAFIDRGYTVKALSKLLGHSETGRVTTRLSLLNLDASLQDGVSKGAITFTQGLAMSRLTVEGQFTLWSAIQAGKCTTPGKLRRLASALLDLENQIDLFSTKSLTHSEKASLTKVDRFVEESGKLLGLISAADLSVVENTEKSDGGLCVDRLLLLAKTCYAVANAIQTSQAKQAAAAA